MSRIGIDLDDCMTAWYKPAHAAIVAAGLDNGVTPTTWRPYLEYGIEEGVWVGALADATESGELYRSDPYPGAAEAVRRLYWAGHEIHIITARGTTGWPDAPLLPKITQGWLWEHAIPHHALRFLKDKASAGMDYFIDDSPGNFEALHAAGVKVYLLDQPHNQHLEVCWAPHGERVPSVGAFADIILQRESP